MRKKRKKGRLRMLLAALLLLIEPAAAAADSAAAAWIDLEVPGAALPVLEIETRSRDLPGEGEEPGVLRVLETFESGGEVPVLETPIRIRLRGNTSRRFPKESYKMELVDLSGRKRKLSIAGLREDDDWILNPMYSDTSKIREAVSLWLWDNINSQGRTAAGSRLRYVELLLNGVYWGLYGLQERVDRRQVDADRKTGIVYKIRTNDIPSAQILRGWTGNGDCGGIALAFSGGSVKAPWLPAADYVSILEGEEPRDGARLSPENTVDYALLAVLVQAMDGHFKNQYIHCRLEHGAYVMYRIPWDLDHTLGDLWNGDRPGTNYIEYGITRPALDDAARALLSAGDEAFVSALKARWTILRSGRLTEETILSAAQSLFDALYPAILRDSERWPGCGMGEGSAANIRDIRDYFHIMLPRVDGWVGSLGGM